MTLVHVRLRVPSATGEAPAAGMLTCTPLLRRHLEDLDRIVLPAPFRVVLDAAGEVDIELAPTGLDWCWQVREDVRAGIIRHVLVPDVATVDYGDLTDVDPTTLDQDAPPSPAWLAQLAAEAAEREAADVALGVRIDTASGAVQSVNGQVGAVVLDAADVGADPAGAAAAITLTGLDGVPASRTVAGHPLTGNVALTPGDVGAATAAQGALATSASQPGHTHTATQVSDSTVVGRSVLTAATAAAARTAIGAGTSSLTIGTTSGTAAEGTDPRLSDARAPLVHTQAASTISDSTDVGRSILTAVDAPAQRTSLGLGTAATHAHGDYATSAQGATADDAIPRAGVAGLIARTGAGVVNSRTLTGTASKIAVTNGDGVDGNPTITIPDAVVLVAPTLIATTPAPVLTTVSPTFPGGWTLSAGATTDGTTITLPSAGTMAVDIAVTVGQVVQVDLTLSASSGTPTLALGANVAICNPWERVITVTAPSTGTLALTLGVSGWSATVTAASVRRLTGPLSPSHMPGAGEVRAWSGLTAVGLGAGRSVTTAYGLTAVGLGAGYSATTADGLTAVGLGAGRSVTTASGLTAVGLGAGYSATTASGLTAVGRDAGCSATTASGLTAVGRDAGCSATTASGLTAVGLGAGRSATTAYGLTAVGLGAGRSATTADGLTAVGLGAGYSATTASGLTAVGRDAGYSATTASGLTAVGLGAGYSATTADGLTAVGRRAGYSATTASGLTAVGLDAGYTDGITATVGTISHSTCLGRNAQATVSNVCVIGSALPAERQTLCLGNYDALGSGVRGAMALSNAQTLPAANPTGGGILYAEAGALKWRGSSGTITTIASA